MKDLEIGQVLSLRIRIDYFGVFEEKHPYLILDIREEDNIIEVGQLHSLEGKMFEAIDNKNKVIFNTNPQETVIDKDSFIQKNNTIMLEYFDGIEKYRRQKDKLSNNKLQNVIQAYKEYHENNEIPENRIVYLDHIEIEKLNR
ncbi:MAG: hypothetical protein K6G75_00535 [Lachnospiraceae bacterium]|nr:hypothetical protein [Lachnospiraceae bacterium]